MLWNLHICCCVKYTHFIIRTYVPTLETNTNSRRTLEFPVFPPFTWLIVFSVFDCVTHKKMNKFKSYIFLHPPASRDEPRRSRFSLWIVICFGKIFLSAPLLPRVFLCSAIFIWICVTLVTWSFPPNCYTLHPHQWGVKIEAYYFSDWNSPSVVILLK